MAQKMLIDATHAEETRVVVVDGNKLEEFDFETAARRQLAGNIYLAKVTRVEPSLQAAFVDYGGNRHGFLAFNEIHPDYYQIPAADRAALLEEERALADDPEEEIAKPAPRAQGVKTVQRASNRRKPGPRPERASAPDQVESRDISGMDIVEPDGDDTDDVIEGFSIPADASVAQADAGSAADEETASDAEPAETAQTEVVSASDGAELQDPAPTPGADQDEPYSAADHATEIDDRIEAVSDGEQAEDIRPRRKPRMKRYKIQEVIKVRQIMLVQVVKEERGNKGAALTTYLSLAGRYCVLMPNTARGGGISRKITNASDRAKLKAIAGEIKVPEGAGLIIRTAGAQRTKAEIKRDYEYLLRLWEQIRDLTLKSIAPTPIYEEGDLIKRSIRDLYSKNIDEVLVEGEAGYRTAKDFMKMIMPSHARNVKSYTDPMPLFARYQVETTLAGMFNPTVQLPSGGYIVIGITEALVAIDINSGRATREGSIEDTAVKTNLEAAAEIARQLRLRDLAGLIVIDFIDMEERKNNAAVEKMLKDKLKNDRARIQVGRISGFGLLEMSRQRLRPGMLEATTQPCPHCHGTGLIRSDDSMGLSVLRQIEEEGTRGKSREVLVRAPAAVVNFIINQKREHLAQIEARYGMAVRLEADPRMVSPDFEIEKFKTATRVPVAASEVVSISTTMMPDLEEEQEVTVPEAEQPAAVAPADVQDIPQGEGDGGPRKKRRRRRRRRGGGQNGAGEDHSQEAASTDRTDLSPDSDVGSAAPVAASEKGAETGRIGAETGGEADTAPDVREPRVDPVEAETPVEVVPAPKAAPARSRRKTGSAIPAQAEVSDTAPAAVATATETEAEATAQSDAAAIASEPPARDPAEAVSPAGQQEDGVVRDKASEASEAGPDATPRTDAQAGADVAAAGTVPDAQTEAQAPATETETAASAGMDAAAAPATAVPAEMATAAAGSDRAIVSDSPMPVAADDITVADDAETSVTETVAAPAPAASGSGNEREESDDRPESGARPKRSGWWSARG